MRGGELSRDFNRNLLVALRMHHKGGHGDRRGLAPVEPIEVQRSRHPDQPAGDGRTQCPRHDRRQEPRQPRVLDTMSNDAAPVGRRSDEHQPVKGCGVAAQQLERDARAHRPTHHVHLWRTVRAGKGDRVGQIAPVSLSEIRNDGRRPVASAPERDHQRRQAGTLRRLDRAESHEPRRADALDVDHPWPIGGLGAK